MTFYPTVTLIALFGGLYLGLAATLFSALYSFYSIQHGVMPDGGWLALSIFVFGCSLISVVCEAFNRNRARADQLNIQLAERISAQELAVEAQRRSEEELRYFFEHSVVGKSLTLPSGEVRVNEAFARMLGYEKKELEGVSWRDISHPDDVEATQRHVSSLLSGAQDSAHFTKRYLHANGSVVWAEVWTSVRRDSAGGALFFITNVVDITERLKSEEALRESRAILQAAMDQSPAGIAIADAPDGKLRYVNDAGLLIRGGNRESVVNGVGIDRYVASWQLLDLDGRPLRPDEVPLARAVLFGETSSRELVIRNDSSDLRIVHANAAPILDTSGKVTAAIVVFTDMTDRIATEKALAESERNFRNLNAELEKRVEQRTAELVHRRRLQDETEHLAQVGGWEYDVRANLLTWTDVTYEIHECDRNFHPTVETGIGSYAPESRPRITEVLQRAVDTGEPFDEELELITFKGRRKWVRAIAFADLKDGKVERVHGLFQDIQSHKDRLAELQRANIELEGFSYSVSHDLRAPLRAIEGFSALLSKEASGRMSAEEERLLAVIRANARKMSSLIDDLLKFSRTGRGEIRRGKMDMKSLAQSAFEEASGNSEAQAKIDFSLTDLPDTVGDNTLIRQVWINLLTNAVKYSSTQSSPTIDVRGAVEADFVVYQVRDNGVGFDPKYADKLFGVFQRLHGVKEFDGTGIGLALVKRIVERHGGRVWAEGQVGKGATFSFSLPVMSRTEEAGTTVARA